MLNYSLIYGVSETAKIFEVDIQTIKKWAHIFKEYLSPVPNPGKGNMRQFTIEDLRIFAYVSLYWESDPDIECIRIGLNSNSQYESDDINDFITGLQPLFQNMPGDIDETWRGVVFGGEFELGDLFDMADSFKLAGDKLVEIAYHNHEERELFQPAIYNYRHSTELYIKALIGEEITHDLRELFNKMKEKLKADFNTVPPKWFENIIMAFHKSDPNGTTFR